MHSMIGKSRLFGVVVMGLLSAGVAAQDKTAAQDKALSTHDYAQAERFMGYNAVRNGWTTAISGIATTTSPAITSC